jgi:hypothetical protein
MTRLTWGVKTMLTSMTRRGDLLAALLSQLHGEGVLGAGGVREADEEQLF